MGSNGQQENEAMKKAAFYMSSNGGNDWEKGAAYADEACETGEGKKAFIASIFCHKKLAEGLTEEDDLVEAAHEWKAVFDKVIVVRERIQKGEFELKDFEHTFIGMAQDDALYGMALSLYTGLLEKNDMEDRDAILQNMVEGLECVDSPKAKLLLSLGYDMQSKRKQAAKLLRRILETTDYAGQEKQEYEEFVYFHAVVCLAAYYRDGLPNYIDKNTRQAVATLDDGIAHMESENLKQALVTQREKCVQKSAGKQLPVEKNGKANGTANEPEFVMGNGVVYSRSRMKASVDMCSERFGLNKVIENANQSLWREYPTDEEYLKNNLCSWKDTLLVFGVGLLGFNLAFGLVFSILRWIFRWRITDNTFVAIIIILANIASLIFCIHDRKEENRKVMESDDFRKMREERDWRDKHIPEIKRLIEQSKTELSELEQTMNDRKKCIIPQDYWGVAGYLWSYIENGRADNLKEAINLHEEVMHRLKVENVMSDIFLTAQKTQQISEDAGYQAAQAALSADRAASYAQDARFWSMLNYFSNR